MDGDPEPVGRRAAKGAQTLEKEAAREQLRQMLTRHLEPIADALVRRALGVRQFITRNKKTGKFEFVTDPKRVLAALNGEGDESGEFYTDQPDVAAIREILDRTIDKPKEQVEMEVRGDCDKRVEMLTRARERDAEYDKREGP